MSGKRAQKSQKPDWIPAPYRDDFLSGLDGRTQVARELRLRLSALHRDLGGEDQLSYQRRALCRRAIHLEARLESMENAFASGEAVEVGHYVVTLNSLVGVFKALGLDRTVSEASLREVLQGSGA